MKVEIIDLGRMPYREALAIQQEIMKKAMDGEVGDTLLLVEHDPVITKGIRSEESHLLADSKLLKEEGIEVVEVRRGGDVTYHGPGQLVGYPIINLRNNKLKLRTYIEKLMSVIVTTLRESGIEEIHTEEGHYTGVWVGNEKITAIGVEVKRGVTMHGFAFNINTDIDDFRWIVPCGLADRGVTSLERLTGEKQDFEVLKNRVVEAFCRIFEVSDPVMKNYGDMG